MLRRFQCRCLYCTHERRILAGYEGCFSYEPEVVVEEYIEGREFSVGVVDGKAYPIIEIAPIEGFYDYTNKYKAGATVDTCPAVLTEEQTKEMQKHARDALPLSVSKTTAVSTL